MKATLARLIKAVFSSYQRKLLATLIFFSALTFPLSTYNRVMLTQKFIYQREINRVLGLSSILTSEFSENLSENDSAGLENMLAVVKNLPKVDGVSVVSPGGTVLFSTFPEKKGMINDLPNTGPPPFFMGGIMVKSFPIQKNGQNLGTLQLSYSLREAKSDMISALEWSVAINLAILAILLTISYFASKKLLQPLEKMVNFSVRIAMGDFTARVDIETRDIIGELGMAMNTMAEKIGDLTANMNRRIEDATLHLKTQNTELQRVNIEKNEILGIAAHDLRNPISIIEMYSSFLINKIKDGDLAKLENFLNVINESSKFMLTLLNDLLDISVIESGKLNLQFSLADLRETVENQVKLFQDLAARKRLSIVLTAGEADYFTKIDRNKIQQVINNLLDNAVKYSYQDKALEVELDSVEGTFFLEIRNFGPPIPPNDLSKLFKTFGKTGVRPTGGEKSTGLGLAIARKIVEGHGGDIRVESSLEKGTTFRISLPSRPFPAECREVS